MVIATQAVWSKQAGQGKAVKGLLQEDVAAAATVAAHVAQKASAQCNDATKAGTDCAPASGPWHAIADPPADLAASTAHLVPCPG